jgi:hypothetical protein
VNVLANDQRGQGGPFNAPAVVRTASGTTAAGGTFACSFTGCRYTAPAGYLGPDSFSYSLGYPVPGGGTTSAVATAVVTITVVANEPPTAVDDAATTTGRLLAVVQTASNDLDPNLGQVGERLLPVIATSSSAFGGTVQCGDDGFGNRDNCVYRAAEGFTGTDTFTYTVADTNGATATATVSIEVAPNEAPTAVDDTASFAVSYSGGPPQLSINVTANDTDPEGQVLAAVPTAAVSDQGGAVSCERANCLYTPPDGFAGTDTFQYVADDGAGGISPPVTVTVTIAADLPPVANEDTATVHGTAPVVIPVFDNDTDDAADVRLDGFDATSAAGGTVSCTSQSGTGINHGCTYRAPSGFVGTDTFTYRVTDATGGQNTDTATVTVTVTANADPVAHDDVFDRRNENCCDTAPYDLDVTRNDTDAEGDTLEMPVAFLTSAAGADVVCADEICEYMPPATLVPTDSFEYTVADGHGGSSTATVTVYLLDNAPPQARDDTATALPGQTVTIPVAANDVDPSWWELSGSVTADATSAAGGTISCTDLGPVTNGRCTYTPPAGFVGTDTFGYVFTDPNGAIDAATVTIVVSDEESTSDTAPAGGTVGTDDEADGATADDPVETVVQLGATGGAVSITERPTQTPPPAGYALLGTEVVISAPAATPGAPIRLTFVLDASLVPAGVLAGDVVVFRNGAALADCTGTPGTASPDPCVAVRADLAGGDIRIEALTSAASTWGLGVTVPEGPTADAGGPYTVDEGGRVALDGSGSVGSGPLTYAWSPAARLQRATTAAPWFVGVDDEVLPVTLQVTDGPSSDTDETAITVRNVAPRALLTGPSTVELGRRTVLYGLVDDPGLVDDHTLTVDWADGTTTSVDLDGRLFRIEHTYASVGERTVRVTVADDDGASTAATTMARVRFAFDGFLGSVQSPPYLNSVRAGDTVTLRFGLGGAHGLGVLATGSPTSVRISCTTGQAVAGTELPLVSTAGLTFAKGEYRFAWATERSFAGTCRRVQVGLIDGSVHTALFRFR